MFSKFGMQIHSFLMLLYLSKKKFVVVHLARKFIVCQFEYSVTRGAAMDLFQSEVFKILPAYGDKILLQILKFRTSERYAQNSLDQILLFGTMAIYEQCIVNMLI